MKLPASTLYNTNCIIHPMRNNLDFFRPDNHCLKLDNGRQFTVSIFFNVSNMPESVFAEVFIPVGFHLLTEIWQDDLLYPYRLRLCRKSCAVAIEMHPFCRTILLVLLIYNIR